MIIKIKKSCFWTPKNTTKFYINWSWYIASIESVGEQSKDILVLEIFLKKKDKSDLGHMDFDSSYISTL